jgi:uncharacterized protein
MALLAIGPHVFDHIGPNPQAIERESNANWPAIARFGGPVARQATGEGEHSIRIRGLVFPHDLGGWGDYEAIRGTQLAQEPVLLIGFGVNLVATVLGLCVILKVSDTQEYLGPDGIGQKVQFDIDLAPFDDEGAYFGGLFL